MVSKGFPENSRPRKTSGAAYGLILWGLVTVAVLVGCEDPSVIQQDGFIRLSQDVLIFGRVPRAQQRIEAFELAFVGGAAPVLLQLRVDDSCSGCFQPLLDPIILSPNQSVSVPVRFRPNQLGAQTATLTIERPEADTLKVGARGIGEEGLSPDIAIQPSALDFGFVAEGGAKLGTLEIRSTGRADLLVDRIFVRPEGAPFRVTTATPTPVSPGRLAPGQRVELSLEALGRVLPPPGELQGELVVETNAPLEKNVPGQPGTVVVPIVAEVNQAPVALTGPDRDVDVFSVQHLDAQTSFDPDIPPDLPLSFQWRLIQVPPGSSTVLVGAQLAQPQLETDIAGLYVAEVVVRDARGVESFPAQVRLRAVASEALHIELTWDHPDADLDLHLLRSSGVFCDCLTTVHYRDCARTPNWFPDTPGANPRLDVDDRAGFGPENINIDGDGPERFVPSETFRVAVHYFSDAAETSIWPTSIVNATVRLYSLGTLVAEVHGVLTAEKDLWHVGAIAWPNRLFTTDGELRSNQQCGLL